MKRKNKTTKYILAGLFLSSMMGVTTACDPLGIEPTTKVDEERFWENPQLARSYVTISISYPNRHLVTPSSQNSGQITVRETMNRTGIRIDSTILTNVLMMKIMVSLVSAPHGVELIKTFVL